MKTTLIIMSAITAFAVIGHSVAAGNTENVANPTVVTTAATCSAAQLSENCSYSEIALKVCKTLGFDRAAGMFIEDPYVAPDKPVQKLISCTN